MPLWHAVAGLFNSTAKDRTHMSAGDWKDCYQAAVQGQLSVVAHHIAHGVDPDHQHPEIMRTLLVASLVEGRLEVARFLLEQGANPQLESGLDGLTPLEAALAHGHHGMAAMLRAAGARPRPRSIWTRWFRAWRLG